MSIDQDDLRAGIAAGIISEEQASRLQTLTQSRAGLRDAMPADEEQFELFRGFSEIFISVGLTILMIGLTTVTSITGALIIGPIVTCILAILFANYFTIKRRMALPSITITIAFTCAFYLLVEIILDKFWLQLGDIYGTTIGSLIITFALIIWYYRYKIPFTMFLIGLLALVIITTLTNTIKPADISLNLTNNSTNIFNLSNESSLAYGTLLFGIAAFITAMLFDMKDPHRLGRFSASAFWLHLLAAPALVNTIAMTFAQMGSGIGYFFLTLTLVAVTLIALIIDRRSFLTAGIAYFGFLISLLLRGDTGFYSNIGQFAWTFILLGGFITIIGAFWTQARRYILLNLPEFPGKHRLPPY